MTTPDLMDAIVPAVGGVIIYAIRKILIPIRQEIAGDKSNGTSLGQRLGRIEDIIVGLGTGQSNILNTLYGQNSRMSDMERRLEAIEKGVNNV